MEERRDLRRALAHQDLQLYYQPIFDPRSGRAVSFEALLRGREDDRRQWDIAGVTSTAERGEDIFELERWVVELACRETAELLLREFPDLLLNLNISAREFQNRDFLPTLDAVCKESRIPPGRINLEITETASIHQPSQAEEMVKQLQSRGFHIWLDDFGTGHSSLAWLKWFSVNGLKIPSIFTCDVVADQRSALIVEAITLMARRLDVAVVAEGVESREQLDFLLARGADLMQGFYFGRPVPVEELQITLAEPRREA